MPARLEKIIEIRGNGRIVFNDQYAHLDR
jgi:hypothetical protein